ncbi:hypothetical protein HPB50_009845 [Hyalomma asiaticum]|uniref:Uncharacterized protein n=1 Tax=Hyalomma asiaticum TaxID=266040 RepID=A0ACB7S1H3_HYAAI|nr:hypothetical protein HPB50_009845 [Hyalomma asiaticum]
MAAMMRTLLYSKAAAAQKRWHRAWKMIDVVWPRTNHIGMSAVFIRRPQRSRHESEEAKPPGRAKDISPRQHQRLRTNVIRTAPSLDLNDAAHPKLVQAGQRRSTSPTRTEKKKELEPLKTNTWSSGEGGPLSPYVSSLERRLISSSLGFRLRRTTSGIDENRRLPGLTFADDIVLMAEST